MKDSCFGFNVQPQNFPANRAGVYRITNLLDGKICIGISKNLLARARQHSYPRGATKLARAVAKHGVSTFLFEPLFYCLDGSQDNTFLSVIEAEKIAELDSVSSGYNIIEACGRVGPYGPEFGKTIAAAHARRTPEERSEIARRAKAATSIERMREIGRTNALSIGSDELARRMRSMQSARTLEQRQDAARLGGLASAKAAQKNPTLMASRKAHGSKLAAMHTTEDMQARYAAGIGLGSMTKDALRVAGKKGVEIANARRTPEQRSALGKMANAAAHSSRTQEDRKALARKAGIAGGAAYAAKTSEEKSSVANKVRAARLANGTTSTPTKGGKWINNGVIRKRTEAGQEVPEGWTVGWHLAKASRNP